MAPATENSVQILTEAKNSDYPVVAFALDLTGKKPIDEICRISAYHGPSQEFDQYVMTHRDISRSSVRSHGIRIFTMFGKYRVLKDMNTMKTLHTKSEYSALNDFIKWLTEQVIKGSSSQGIILAFHDSGADKVTPYLIEALERYQLTEEFFKIVKGFVNCTTVASTHPDIKGRSLALRSLARRLLGEEEKNQNNSSTKRDSSSSEEDGPKTDASGSEEDGPKTDVEVTMDSDENKEKVEEDKDDKITTDMNSNIITKVEGDKKKKNHPPREKTRLRDSRDREISVMKSAKFRALTTFKLLQKMTMTNSDDPFGDNLLQFLTTKDEVCKKKEEDPAIPITPTTTPVAVEIA
jgi:hypothetical protein